MRKLPATEQRKRRRGRFAVCAAYRFAREYFFSSGVSDISGSTTGGTLRLSDTAKALLHLSLRRGPFFLAEGLICCLSVVVKLEHRHERLLGKLHGAYAAHLLLAFLLLFEKLLFTGDIAAVALGKNVLAESLYGFAGDDFSAYGSLNRNLKKLCARQKNCRKA